MILPDTSSGDSGDWYLCDGAIPVEWIKGVVPFSDETREMITEAPQQS